MNNVKVRIYELSKELNLENRDILAVCERLNIAVKSHSSTITESDAQRIEKYVETHPIENHPDSKSEGGSHSSKLSDSLDHPKKKQQILEIRKPKLQVNSNSQGFSTPENHSEPQPATQAPPSVPFPSSSEQPTLLERPVLSKPNTAPQSPLKPVSEPQAEVSEDNNSPVKPETLVLESNQPDSLQLSPADEIAPELVSPPVRPPEPSSVQPAVVKNKPILKSNKPAPKSAPAQQPAAKTSDKPTPKPTKSRPVSPGPKSSDSKEPKKIKEVKRGERTPRKEITALKPQPSIPQLQPPPNRASNDLDPDLNDNEEGNEETQDDLLLSTDGDIDLEVKRPKKTLTAPKKQLTRPGSKKSAWEEEEEDPNKAAKANKAKRPRKPMIDEDDEDDFEGGLSDLSDSNPALTLSLARPPKPKNGSSSPKPPTSSVKKPAPIRGGSSSDNGSSKSARHTEPDKPQRPEILVLSGAITIQELANTLVVPVTEIIKRLFTQGIAVNITETLDLNIIEMICEEFEVVLETEQEKAAAEKPDNIFNEEDLENLQRRPPVVTIMGHVDHGKTTLLDSIRQAKVAQGEAGGITQHIGAYHVDVEHEGQMQQVVFLDTPGHEAFTAMRARGARVTDIAILVVAADDGVRPQTIEAIGHAKAAGVPIIVAINKIDKESAQPDRVKQELMEHNLVPEEWGGETIMVPVSAINGENLDLLLEMIILVSQVEDLEANPDRAARGAVIETHLDKARGPVATLLVQNGTLRVGDIIVAGSALGKVRAMIDDRGERVDVASPSFAVEILGLRDVPAAGDEFEVFENEKEAAVLANQRSEDQRETRIKRPRSLTNLWLGDEKQGELNIILKTDVQGSVEAIVNALEKLPQKEVELRLLLAAPGEVTETDIDFATASDAVLIGFNTTLANGARQAADRLGVDIREYSIIYNLLDDIQAAMEGLLEPELVPEELGQAEVRAIFPVGRSKVAGCYIQSGKVIRNCKVRVYRKGNKIHEGILDSLKRMREDAKEVNAGYECGMGLDSFNDWEEGDIIEAYRMVTKRRTLSV